MPNMREIRERIASIQQILKITNAMYLMSSSKLKKARKSLEATEPYFYKLQSTIDSVLEHTPHTRQQFFNRREDIPEEKSQAVEDHPVVEMNGKVVHVMQEIPEEEIPERDRVHGDDLVHDNP